MAQSNPTRDVSPSIPSDAFSDPFSPLSNQLKQFKIFLNVVSERDPEEFINGLVEDILHLPVEKRFTDSTEVLIRHIDEEYGSADALRSQLPIKKHQLIQLLDEVFDEVLVDVLRGVFFIRNPEGHLVMAAAIEEMRSGLANSIELIESDDFSEERLRVLLSSSFALYSRLYDVVSSEEPRPTEELVRDIARSHYYKTKEFGQPIPSEHPDEMSSEDVMQMVIEYGSGIAYRELGISVSRGAELARSNREEFIHVLNCLGIKPRFGPNSPDEILNDEFE